MFLSMISFYSCEKKSDAIIDPTLIAPSISNPSKSKDTIYTSSDAPVINLITTLKVQWGSNDDVGFVFCDLLAPNGNTLGTYSMRDDGASGDTTGGNGIYTATINSPFSGCLTVGNYTLQYTATSASGLTSNLIVLTQPVYYSNNVAPVVSFVNAPDTLTRPTSGEVPLVLSIKGSDPNGQCDIRTVFFNSILPNGTPSGQNPFIMFDDGDLIAHGDSVAGDGRFSLIIRFPSTANLGTYQFNYQAIDNRGLSSAILNKPVFVRNP